DGAQNDGPAPWRARRARRAGGAAALRAARGPLSRTHLPRPDDAPGGPGPASRSVGALSVPGRAATRPIWGRSGSRDQSTGLAHRAGTGTALKPATAGAWQTRATAVGVTWKLRRLRSGCRCKQSLLLLH